MTFSLKLLPILFSLIAAPAFAAQADSHVRHHPAATGADAKAAAPAASTAEPKPATKGCPMMDGGASTGPGSMAGGKMMDGKMMMDGKDMHCMTAPAPKAAEPPHDHDHPAAPVK